MHEDKQSLLLEFDCQAYSLTAEFLRVNQPMKHGNNEIIAGKKDILITSLAFVGAFALNINFSDNTSSIYSFVNLEQLCLKQAEIWQDYLLLLEKHNLFRTADTSEIKILL